MWCTRSGRLLGLSARRSSHFGGGRLTVGADGDSGPHYAIVRVRRLGTQRDDHCIARLQRMPSSASYPQPIQAAVHDIGAWENGRYSP